MKRFMAILLCAVMVFSLTVTAFAANGDGRATRAIFGDPTPIGNGVSLKTISQPDVLSGKNVTTCDVYYLEKDAEDTSKRDNCEKHYIREAKLNGKVVSIFEYLGGGQSDNTANGYKQLYFGDSIYNIPEKFFSSMRELETIVVGRDVRDIGAEAFANNAALENVLWRGANTVKISDKMFYNCPELKKVDFRSGISGIGKDAFTGDDKLGELDNYGNHYWNGYLVKGAKEVACIEVMPGTKGIADGAFDNNANLSLVKLPKGLAFVGKDMFCSETKAKPVFVVFDGTKAEWEKIPNAKDAAKNNVCVVCSDGMICGGAFSDVAAGQWYTENVARMRYLGYMMGYEDKFRPEDTLTRAEAVQIFCNIDKMQRPTKAGPGKPVEFTDVDKNAWYYDAIRWGYDHGVAGGYGDNKFGPEDPVTREQFTAMMYRFVGGEAEDFALEWTDADDISVWAVEVMRWAAKNGILMHGKYDVRPQDSVTRAEAAAIIDRTMGDELEVKIQALLDLADSMYKDNELHGWQADEPEVPDAPTDVPDESSEPAETEEESSEPVEDPTDEPAPEEAA